VETKGSAQSSYDNVERKLHRRRTIRFGMDDIERSMSIYAKLLANKNLNWALFLVSMTFCFGLWDDVWGCDWYVWCTQKHTKLRSHWKRELGRFTKPWVVPVWSCIWWVVFLIFCIIQFCSFSYIWKN